MTEQTKAPKKSLEATLALLKEKQKAIAFKAAQLEKEIEAKRNAATQAMRAKVGKLAEEAGILELTEAVLAKAFAVIAANNGVSQKKEVPQTENS